MSAEIGVLYRKVLHVSRCRIYSAKFCQFFGKPSDLKGAPQCYNRPLSCDYIIKKTVHT